MTDLDARSDEELVRVFQAGDQDAFRVLTDRYSARLQGQILRRLSPALRRRVAVSDILQEAHLVALEKCAEFEDRGEGSFGRWFRQIVELRIREAVRKHVDAEKRSVGKEVSRPGRRPTGDFPAREHSPSQLLIGEEAERAAAEAMAELPAPYREVLELVRGHGLSTAEAASRMGRSRESVRQLYVRALARLERMLGLAPGGSDGRRRPTR
jgi:RNA polymerase sigma-70 factor (ECF subfamily)